MMDPEIIIDLTLGNMRQAIIHHLSMASMELNERVEQELDKVINEFDFGEEIRKAAHAVLQDSVREYFNNGPGRQILKDSVYTALGNILLLKEK